jgi:hypothetical protein
MRISLRVTKKMMPAAKRMEIMWNNIAKVFDRVGTQSIAQRHKVIATWQEEVPSWFFNVNTMSYGLRLRVYMTGDAFGMKKWKWLAKGTRVRHAFLSRDWQSKTKPRVIKSYPGRGRVLRVSKKFKFPGIEAREFDRTINIRMSRRARPQIESAVLRALKRKRA